MFTDEIRSKLGAEAFPFSVCMLAKNRLVVSGVKSVLSVESDRLALSLPSEVLLVEGEGLRIAEIGGGEIYVRGDIGGLSFEKKTKKM